MFFPMTRRIRLPKVGKIRWRADGFGIQHVTNSGGTLYKVWEAGADGPNSARVVDTALSAANARRRIVQIKERELKP